MSIDPKTSAWWNFAFALLTLVGVGTLKLAGIPDGARQLIESWAIDLAAVIACANIVFHLFSSTASGPLVK